MGRKDHKEIGARFRQIREHLVETQTVFAQRFGLSRDDVANYERGRCDIPTRVLAELDRMGFNVSWVLRNQGEMVGAEQK